MKTRHLLLVCVLLVSGHAIYAQESDTYTNELGQTVRVTKPISFSVSPPVSTMPEADGKVTSKKIMPAPKVKGEETDAYPKGGDPVKQTIEGTRQMRAPIVNFDGQPGTVPPPDPSGAAGPNHYVQAVNRTFRVYDKLGNPLTNTVSLMSLFPTVIESMSGDPIVMYDRHADRWVIAMIEFSPDRVVMAISQTADPTGSFYIYSFPFMSLPDYPKFSVWWDGYYMTANFTPENAVVFERAELLQGNPLAQMITLSVPNIFAANLVSALPSDADGPLPPNGTPCYFFNLEDDDDGAVQDQVSIYEMNTDWTTPANTQIALSQQIALPSFYSGYPFEVILQPGTWQLLDAMTGIFMYRAQHIRWMGYNTVMLSHSIQDGINTQTRWYELRDNNNGVWYIHQSGTYVPDNSDRWMASVAMNMNGSIGMAYSQTNYTNNIYPSLCYTGRYASDSLGQMTFAEQKAVSGQGSQSAHRRFGDYSHLSLDPDGETFWYTGEYLGPGGSVRTRIFSFNLEDEASTTSIAHDDIELLVHYGSGKISVNASGIESHDALSIALIGMDGRIIESTKQIPVNKSISHFFQTNKLPSGTYFVRMGNSKVYKTERVIVHD